jgi:hypothetical protein
MTDTTNSCPNCNSMALELERLRTENDRLIQFVCAIYAALPATDRQPSELAYRHLWQVAQGAPLLLKILEDIS